MHPPIPAPATRPLGRWLLCLFALVLSSAAWAQRGDDGFYRIEQALYGTEQQGIDVTRQLQQLVRRDQPFQVDNDLFQNDPVPGQRKVLRIYARGQDGQQRTFVYREGSWVDGAQFRGRRGGERRDEGYGRLTIHRALYGDGYRQFDITERLRSYQRGGRLEVEVGNDLAGADPAPYVRKNLRVEFSIGNGPVQQIVVPESQLLRLP